MTKEGVTVHLTAAEVEGLKRAFPDMSVADAARVAVQAEMKRRYLKAKKAGRVFALQALERAIEQS